MLTDLFAGAAMIIGVTFFTAGTIGLIRFPDVRSQLHALTKADNLGLGFLLLGAAVHLGSLTVSLALFLLWLLALGSSSVSARVLGEAEALSREGGQPGAGAF